MIFYDLLLFLSTLFISIKKPHHFRRLFATIPNPRGREVIWVHAVSVGEAKSVQTLFESLRKAYPDAFFLVTTTTATGQAEAIRSLKGADAFSFLPVDLRFVVNRWVRKLRPKWFFLVESDFWPNLLRAIKKGGGNAILVSGKLSERSARRFQFFRYFAKKLFGYLDLICVQNEEHAKRFFPFCAPSRIVIGGNLKLDHKPTEVDRTLWQQKLALQDPAITLSCTHSPEEEDLLERIPLDRFFVFLAPRHPERFSEVASLLEKKKIPYFRWTKLSEKKGGERVLLVDAMGQLAICYALSRLAVVGGSFQPHIGGHNILEPCLYGVPVFFGPHMEAQKELVDRVLAAKAGKQLDSSDLTPSIETFFNTPSLEESMRLAAARLVAQGRGSSMATFEQIQNFAKRFEDKSPAS